MSAINVVPSESTAEERSEAILALREKIPFTVGMKIRFTYEHRIAGNREQAVDTDNTVGMSVVETTINSILFGEAGYGGRDNYAALLVNTPSIVVWYADQLQFKELVSISLVGEKLHDASWMAHVRLNNGGALRFPVTIFPPEQPESPKSRPSNSYGQGGGSEDS